MRLSLHPLPVTRPSWIANDPMIASGDAGLAAYYAVLFSQPEFLLWEGVVHVLPVIGYRGALPSLPAGEPVFYDGLPHPMAAGAPTALPGWITVTALKERLITDHGSFLIPENLDLGVWTKPHPNGWTGVGDRDGQPFFQYDSRLFLSPVHTGYTDFLLRRDRGRHARDWRLFTGEALARWLINPKASFRPRCDEEAALRDAFGAYGFHTWLVGETATLLGAEPELEAAQTQILAAAEAFLSGELTLARSRIHAAFIAIGETLDALTGTKERLFAEAHHGGMLHEDIGFFEHDWPQMVCDMIRESLAYQGVVLSLDMPSSVFRHYRNRFPAFFSEMCQWMREGRLELLNGMYGQPFSDTHSLENLLSQCLKGQQELRELFGKEAEIFASEEYCIGPGMAQVLAAAGYQKAVHAVRLGGISRQSPPVVRRWSAQAGAGSLDAIEHPDVVPPGNSTGYFLQLPQALAQTRRHGHPKMALFNIPDFGWNILFRDELFTALEYGAPVFRLVTFGELFAQMEHTGEALPARWEDSYHSIFNHYTIRGDLRRYFEKLREVELALTNLEAQAWARGEPSDALEKPWRDYLLGSSHDYTIVGQGHNGWYGTATKATYHGPNQSTFARTLESEMLARFEPILTDALASAAKDTSGRWLRNPHGFPLRHRFIDTVGKTQELLLPPFGTVEAPQQGPPPLPKEHEIILGDGFRMVVNPQSGTIETASCDGATLWEGNLTGLVQPGQTFSIQDGRLDPPTATSDGLSLLHRGRLVNHLGETQGWIETRYHWQPQGQEAIVEVLFAPASIPPRAQFDWEQEWKRTFRYALPRLRGSRHLLINQGNTLFEADPARRSTGPMATFLPDAQAHVLSPELLGQAGRVPLWLYNDGCPIYFVYPDRVEQPLRLPGEEKLLLRFGIGFGHTATPPLQRSRAALAPPFRTTKPLPALPLQWGSPEIGLIRIEPREGGVPRLWFFNFSAHTVAFHPQSQHLTLSPPASASGPLNECERGWTVRGYELISLEATPAKAAPSATPQTQYSFTH